MLFYAQDTNVVEFQNSGAYAFKLGGTTWGSLSDARLKKNVREITDATGKLNALNPTHFEFINAGPKGHPEGTRTGFIAQEFEQVFPGHVIEGSPFSDEDQELLGEGVKAKLLEADLVPYLVKAIQELSARIEQLENS
jgi:hypothetical protein